MPYNIVTKDGIELNNIPDTLAPDAPQLKQLVAQERQRRKTSSPEYKAQAEAMRAADKERYDPTKGMGWGEKALVNVGAGMDSMLTGAKQVGTKLFGSRSDDAEIEAEIGEKRARDKHLADSTVGGSALQFAGEAIPTLVLPAGGFLRGAQAAGRTAQAVAGAGARALPQATARMGSGAAMGDAALAGAALGALNPTMGEESRLMNMGIGAAGGAVLPGAVAAFQKGRGMLTRGGARDRVAGELQDAVGPSGMVQAKGDLQTYYPKGAEDIPVSVAGQTQNAALARMEAGSRTRDGSRWHAFDQTQGQKVWENVQRATAEAEDLAARKAARSENWDSNWAKAEANTRPRNFASLMGKLKLSLAEAAGSPDAVNKQVMEALKSIDEIVVGLGQDFSPAHLQKLRAEFNGKVVPMADNALKAAPRDNPAIISLIQEMDDILNKSTGGKWDKVRKGYAADSEKVYASKAAGRVREAFIDTPTGRVQGRTLGDPDTPAITQAGLGRAMNAAREPRTNKLLLSGPAEQRLQATLDALRRQDIVQGVKKSATAGGGSNTSSDLFAAAEQQAGAGGGITAMMVQALRKGASRRYDEALAEALQNPQVAISMLERKIAARQPLTASEEMVLNALRAGGAGAGPALLQSNAQ
jgi:hypothetical protein